MSNNRNLKDQILKLRQDNIPYRKIAQLLNCSLSCVNYAINTEKCTKYRRNLRKSYHPFIRKTERFMQTKRKSKGIRNRANHIEKFKRLILQKIKCYFKINKEQIVPTFTYEDVINKFGEKPTCYLTGEELNIYEPRTYQFDHIIPKSKGGQSTLDNLGICTALANRVKYNMTPDEFFNFCKKVLNHQGYTIDKNHSLGT